MKRKITETARKLRRNSTQAEGKLWRILRGRNFAHLKFRRQFPLGRYIVDFVSLGKKIIIEADGGQHNEFREDDIPREEWLKEQGFVVIRFWNNDIKYNIKRVMQVIKDNIDEIDKKKEEEIIGG